MFRNIFKSDKSQFANPTQSRKLLFDPASIISDSVSEAIEKLGLIKPSATEEISALIPLCGQLGYKAVAAQFRKDGLQITNDEKKAVGVRPNAYFSRRAYEHLTELGKSRAIDAHYLTIWRAHATTHRANEIFKAAADEHGYLKSVGEHKDGCMICKEQSKSKLSAFDVSPFPPSGCRHEACCLHYLALIDWAAKAR